ncbi:MAG: MFS transporter, partial [Candidatus Hydrogenedentota bacterium]
SICVALLAALFVRDTPEQLGLSRDGTPPQPDPDSKTGSSMTSEHLWTARQAIFTAQFLLISIAGIAYATPWGVVVSQMTLHLTEKGFEIDVIASLLGSLALVSILGRLTGILGDKLNPRYVIIAGLIVEGIGTAGFYFVDSKLTASICLLLIGIGFGSTYVCIPALFSDYFGRKAFGTTAGTRMLITGVFNGAGPWVTGLVADKSGYFIPFMALAVLCFIGSFAAAVCTDPGPPPGSKSEPEPA